MILIHNDLHHRIIGESRSCVTGESIILIGSSGQNDHFVPMISLFLRADRYASVGSGLQIQAVSVKIELRRYNLIFFHGYFHGQVGGGRRSGIAIKSIIRIRSSRQRNNFFPMINFFFRTDGNEASIASSEIQVICVKMEVCIDFVILLHADDSNAVCG